MEPITHSPDIRRLAKDGYEIQVVAGYLVVHNVPYLDSRNNPAHGTLFTALDTNGTTTAYHAGSDHTVLFAGEFPNDASGIPMAGIRNESRHLEVLPGVWADHRFSARPQNNYRDYHHKMTAYIRILGQPLIQKGYLLSARPFKQIRGRKSPHKYTDTNSARANINSINDRIAGQRIAIVGVGGTGSYVLDMTTKTHVAEIHLYDGDVLLSHNAFRMPGSLTKARLNTKPNKATYLKMIYSRMHKHVVAHPYFMSTAHYSELDNMDFVFVCMDGGAASIELLGYLNRHNIPCVEVGMGIRIVDNQLHGQIRTTMQKNENKEPNSITAKAEPENAYRLNIQIAELNALNASFAIIAWKRHFDVYPKLPSHGSSIFNLRTGGLIGNENTT